MTSGPVQCVWFKRDLRLADHRPLAEAASNGPVVALYVIEPSIIGAADFDALHWNFIREALAELRQGLRERGGDLLVRRGEAVEVLESVRGATGFRQLWAHEETGNALTFARDRAVADWARRMKVTWTELPQNGVVRGLKARDGWARTWEWRMREPPAGPPERIEAVATEMQPGPLPTAEGLGLEGGRRCVDLAGGETEGRRLLETFLRGRGARYHREMSSPNTAYASCSRLSAYLAWGCLSMRTVVRAARDAAGHTLPKAAARAFLSRCHWHCHFMQKLESEPAIEFHCFNRACDDLRADGNDPDRLAAWQAGRTGYPFVDACMRSLKARGWINFRMRAMLVSFAAYHLWLDWRLFKDWLARQFIDYEPGIHISQVQMQSGVTGINSLRIYSPVKQGKDHDPGGEFIREWVPELRGIAGPAIHEPWTLQESAQVAGGCRIGRDYPLPVVDHGEAVRRARSAFAALRQTDHYWEEAERVMARHGSRKSRENRNRPKRPRPKANPQTEMRLEE